MKKSHSQASSSPKSNLHKIKHHTLNHVKQNETIYFSIALALILLVLFNVNYTGHTISNEDVHIENVGLNFTQNTNIEWTPENEGLLKSIKISGRLIGDGSATIVLVADTGEYVISNTSAIKEQGSNLITANVISNETESDTTEETVVENITETSETLTENATIEEMINISENITIEENVPIIENATKSVLENLTIENQSVDATDISIENVSIEINETTNSTEITINNTDSSEIEINISFEKNTTTLIENMSVEGNETITENITEISSPEKNITEEIATPQTITSIEFNNLCAETCLLPNLNSTSYTIKIIIDNATLIIEQIQYTTLVLEDKTLNVTENTTINVIPETNETITQLSIVEIGKPVKWKRTINTSRTKEIKLPKETFNITISEELNIKVKDKDLSISEYNLEKEYKIADKLFAKTKDIKIEKILKELEKDITNITIDENITLDLNNTINEIVSISYLTEGPEIVEKQKNKYRKEITISSDIHYTDILAYTDIAESEKDSIRLYRTTDGIREPVSIINYSDSNSNGFIDQIYWMVPHLSNQTYEVEIIVLNVQSYPVVEGNWTTRIETSGVGDLRISGINGTTFTEIADNLTTEDDLEFLNLTCGNEQVQDMYIVDSDGEKMPYEAYIIKREIERLQDQLEELK